MQKFSEYIYFDHSATTPVIPEVAKVVHDAMTLYFGNASEPHMPGVEAKRMLENSRAVIAKAINSYSDEILFTSGGTESNNIAIFGIAEAYYKKGNHIITSEIEHPAVHMPLKVLEQEGFKVTYLPVDSNGIVNPDDVKNALTNETILVSIMHANNVMGALQPIEEIGKITRENNIIFHCDAVQSYMSINIDVDLFNVDLLSISGHKIYAPKGVGALFVRRGTKVMPQIYGGGQERGRRSGTENIPGISGLAKATEILSANFNERNEKVAGLRDYLKDRIMGKISDVIYNGHPQKRLPGNCNFTFKYVESADLVNKLNEFGIAVSAGSACKSINSEASEALLAMGICPEYARGSIRISLGFENTVEEVDYLLNILPDIITDLRNHYPLYREKGSDKYFIFR
ncbi:MAG: cysteine desulfurase [Actinobacteria bacterium]|nr:cysteine desulfurase [Actinomycetota bacterium]